MTEPAHGDGPEPLARVQCISFPRCGHHLMERILREYFGERFRYGDIHVDPGSSLDANPEINFLKDHDFDLGTSVTPDRQYLVLVRDPRESIVSWFRLAARKGEVEYTHAAWEKFSAHAWTYWAGFFNKWVIRKIPGRLIVEYADLITSPELILAQVVEFMSHRPACVDTCRAIVLAERVQQKSPRAELFTFGESAGLEHETIR